MSGGDTSDICLNPTVEYTASEMLVFNSQCLNVILINREKIKH